VADDSLVCVDLKVISALEGLVAEEMDLVEVLGGQVVEAVGLVPAVGKDVKGDLPADRIGQVQVTEALLEGEDHIATNAARLIQREGGGGGKGRTRSRVSYWFRSSREQLRPIGEMFSIPARNSTKVPLLMGRSRSAMYLRAKLTTSLMFSSPRKEAIDCRA
jgi:hypothetical protein